MLISQDCGIATIQQYRQIFILRHPEDHCKICTFIRPYADFQFQVGNQIYYFALLRFLIVQHMLASCGEALTSTQAARRHGRFIRCRPSALGIKDWFIELTKWPFWIYFCQRYNWCTTLKKEKNKQTKTKQTKQRNNNNNKNPIKQTNKPFSLTWIRNPRLQPSNSTTHLPTNYVANRGWKISFISSISSCWRHFISCVLCRPHDTILFNKLRSKMYSWAKVKSDVICWRVIIIESYHLKFKKSSDASEEFFF